MKSLTKRIWSHVLFVLFFMMSLVGYPEQTLMISQAQATTLAVPSVPVNEGTDEMALLIEKRQMAEAITQVYKYVKLNEAVKVVDYAYQYSEAYGIQPSLLIGLIATESAFRRRAVSKEGAAGYTQVLARYHKDKIKGRNIFHTGVNIEVGAIIFSDCVKKHKTMNKALGCYNGTNSPKKIAKFKKAIDKRKDQLIQIAML